MDHGETSPIKPKRRWFQHLLKTLFVLAVVAGLPSALYLYWVDWKKHRPPDTEYDRAPYRAAFIEFANDLRLGNMDRAYMSTSARFRKHMSRSELESLIYRFPRLAEIELFEDRGLIGANLNRTAVEYEIQSKHVQSVSLRNWMTNILRIRERNRRGIEVWVWVVMDDSFFERRPPSPRVEEIQVREISETEWESETLPTLLPSWERE